MVSHASGVNLDMFFISVLNTIAGGECMNTDFVFLAHRIDVINSHRSPRAG